MLLSCLLYCQAFGVTVDLTRLVQQAGACGAFINTMISLAVYNFQVKMGCNTLLCCIDNCAGWMIYNCIVVLVMISVMSKLYGSEVNECGSKYMCLACDAVLFNWILVVIDNFHRSYEQRNNKLNIKIV